MNILNKFKVQKSTRVQNLVNNIKKETKKRNNMINKNFIRNNGNEKVHSLYFGNIPDISLIVEEDSKERLFNKDEFINIKKRNFVSNKNNNKSKNKTNNNENNNTLNYELNNSKINNIYTDLIKRENIKKTIYSINEIDTKINNSVLPANNLNNAIQHSFSPISIKK